MKYPKYVKTRDGYIGVFKYLEYGVFPVYRFDGGERNADNWELEHGSERIEDLERTETYSEVADERFLADF